MASSSPPSSNAIPPWLAQSNSQIHAVLQTLHERESTRRYARSFSRPASPRSAQRRHSQLKQDVLDFYSVSVGSHHAHLHRNRYLEVEPYDRSRVVVDAENDDPWYLNASWVLERYGGKWWIATQAPLLGTAHAFLSLILQPTTRPPSYPRSSRLRTVVQLTQNVEQGFRKADVYFPSVVGQTVIISPDEDHDSTALKVTLRNAQSVSEAKCIVSTVSVVPLTPSTRRQEVDEDEGDGDNDDDHDAYGMEEGSPVTFRHLLFYAWPDHGVPNIEDRAALLAFIRLVDSTNRDLSDIQDPSPDPDPPVVVGCSAGIGRTGSFIALCSLLRAHGFIRPPAHPTSASILPRTPLGPLPVALQDDLVLQEIDSLRDQRPGMVQRTEQVLLVYEALKSAFLE